MAWIVIIAAAACTGALIGWPWGAVAAAGCLFLPLLAARLLATTVQAHRRTVAWRAEVVREPVRVLSVKVVPEVEGGDHASDHAQAARPVALPEVP